MAANTERGLWTRGRRNVRNRLISGMLILIPLGVTLLVMRWLFRWMASFLYPIVDRVVTRLTELQAFSAINQVYIDAFVSVLSILVLLTLLYAVGAIGQFVVGRKMIAAGETILLKIPLVRSVYSATKQVLQAVSLPDRAAFKSVVLVEFPQLGAWMLGFLTGHIDTPDGRRFCRVFIPTTPNPTTGFLEIVPIARVTETTVSIEDAFKMVISGGIVCPEAMGSVLPLPVGK